MKNEMKKTLCMAILVSLCILPTTVFAEAAQPDPDSSTLPIVTVAENAITGQITEAAAVATTTAEEQINLPQLNQDTIPDVAEKPATVIPGQTVSGDFTYEDIDGGISLTKYTGTAADVVIPDTLDGKAVIQIGSGTFSDYNTVSITVGNHVKTIKNNAFSNFYLKKVIIPSTTTLIEDGAITSNHFYQMKIIGVRGSAAETYASSLSNSLFLAIGEDENNFWFETVDGGVKIIYYGGTEKAIIVPSTLGGKPVITIGQSAFSNNSSIGLIELKDGIKTIEDNSFGGCYTLSTLYIPQTTTEIGTYAISPTSAIKIIGKAGSYAETYAGTLLNAKFINIDSSESNYWFEDVDGGVKITAYGGTDSIVTIPSTLKGKTVVAIGKSAFKNSNYITEIIVPDTVTILEEPTTYSDGIFKDCIRLEKLTLGKGITQISANMADNCQNLKQIIFNGDIVSIGSSAFNQCRLLDISQLPESLETIGNYAFRRCNNITSIAIPDKTTTIGSGAFVYCEKLENLTLGASLKTLKNGSFSDCASLQEVIFPASLTTINDEDVFARCKALGKAEIPVTTTSISSNIFKECPLLNIYGAKGSYAQTYAEQYGIPFNEKRDFSVLYRTHVQNDGWQGWKRDGEMSGTSARSLRLEAIEIHLGQENYNLYVNYATHIENIGWQEWKKGPQTSGTSGKGLRLEAIRIKLSGNDAEKFDIYYRVHAENVGWMGWAKNGADAGTAGFGYRLEGIEIQLLPKGSPAPGSTDNSFIQK